MDNNKNLEDAKKLNQQSRQGNTYGADTKMTSGVGISDLEEAKKLNEQSRQTAGTPGSAMSNNSNPSMTSGVGMSDLEEAKKLNQQSRQNKK